MTTSRLDTLVATIDDAGLTGMALNAGPSLSYLIGLDFHLMERPVVLLVAPGKTPALVLPRLEARKLDAARSSLEPFFYGDTPSEWPSAFQKAVAHCGIAGGTIGVEPNQMRLLEHGYLADTTPAEFVDGSYLITRLRAQKDATELNHMRQAVRIAEEALEATLPTVKIGVSEKEIGAELLVQLLRHGSENALPFYPIVAAGPNGANPHSTPGDRTLMEGDLLIIDWGARFAGYSSDLTRTFAVGEVDEKMIEIHKLVQKANEAGRAAGRPGVMCKAVDEAARQVIVDGGYGEYFTHRTGHGIGMECHEEPYIHGANERLLEAGNTFTVEPGIYLPGEGGVRIEDDVVVTVDGAESLSTMTREIRRVG